MSISIGNHEIWISEWWSGIVLFFFRPFLFFLLILFQLFKTLVHFFRLYVLIHKFNQLMVHSRFIQFFPVWLHHFDINPINAFMKYFKKCRIFKELFSHWCWNLNLNARDPHPCWLICHREYSMSPRPFKMRITRIECTLHPINFPVWKSILIFLIKIVLELIDDILLIEDSLERLGPYLDFAFWLAIILAMHIHMEQRIFDEFVRPCMKALMKDGFFKHFLLEVIWVSIFVFPLSSPDYKRASLAISPLLILDLGKCGHFDNNISHHFLSFMNFLLCPKLRSTSVEGLGMGGCEQNGAVEIGQIMGINYIINFLFGLHQ